MLRSLILVSIESAYMYMRLPVSH